MANRDASREEKTKAAERMRRWNERRVQKLLSDPNAPRCACGCGEVVTSAFRGAKYAKGHWTLGKEFGDTKKASVSPTLRQIEWAAGFLEGEGSFMATKGSKGYPVAVVTAKQVQSEPLERLQRIFGGTLKFRQGKEVRFAHREKVYKQTDFWHWWCHQSRARGIMMTIYSIMSPRRKEQIHNVLAAWQPNGHATTWQRRRARVQEEKGES